MGKAISDNLISDSEDIFILLSNKNKIKYKNKNVFVEQINLKNYEIVFNKLYKLISQFEIIDGFNIILCGSQLGEPNKDSMNLNLEDISTTFNCNLIGNIAIIKAASQFLTPKSILRVVFFAGGGAAYAYPNFFSYSLSKVATVRAVENLSILLKNITKNTSIIALAPGAVETDMLKSVIENGGYVKTKTDISEPVNFIRNFINDRIPSLSLNGMFIHVRDDLNDIISIVNKNSEIFKLRRIQ